MKTPTNEGSLRKEWEDSCRQNASNSKNVEESNESMHQELTSNRRKGDADGGRNAVLTRQKTKGMRGYLKITRRVCKGVHRGLMVTNWEHRSCLKIIKSTCVEPEGPKECDGRRKRRGRYKRRFGLEL